MPNSPGSPEPSAEGLRPCPFCGGEVMRRDALWPSEGDRDGIIHAEPSECPLRVFGDDTWGGGLYGRWNGGIDTFAAQVAARAMAEERERLTNTPETSDFIAGVVLEVRHQQERWGEAHDRSKSAEQWFWLVGYLAGKALRSHIGGDLEKAQHHTISSAAALRQWHEAIQKDESRAGIGRDDDLRALGNPTKPDEREVKG